MFLKYLMILILSFFVMACNKESQATDEKVVKSSEIPDKREFPINASINPCENFYEYACSKVIETFQLRDDRSEHIFSFSDSVERLLKFKKEYFANLANKNPESEMEAEFKNYYLACMDEEAKKKEEKEFVATIKAEVDRIKTREEFADMVAKNIASGSRLSFIGFNADEPNLDRPEYNDLAFDVGLRNLPERSYYENEELTKELKELIKDFFVTIGESDPEKKAELVFNFEKGLAQIYPLPEEIRDRFTSRTEAKRGDLITKYPNLQLKTFVAQIPEHVVIRDIIKVDTLEFIENKLKTASLDELKSVYLYFQLSSIMDDAYPEYFNKKFEFSKKYLGGPNKRPDRQERCSKAVMGGFTMEVDYILLPKMFPDFPKEKFKNSIEKIRVALMEQLQANNWLSEDAKKEAIRKIEKAKLGLVTPDTYEDWDFNPRTTYATDAPIANSQKLEQLLINKSLKELEGPINTNRWQMGPLTVNAYYNPSYNKIVFPIGILQYPFYDPNEPEEVNLAAIGSIIGHELGHSIDNHGNKYDADGVFRSWMVEEDVNKFDERTKPLIKQFDKIGHNGKFTLGENIGDLVGVTTSYKAAFPEGKEHDQELKKKFFLQYARVWCEVERPGFTQMRLKVDPHSLGYARVNEQIKQQKGFKEAYNCKPGDPMVISKEEQVKIW